MRLKTVNIIHRTLNENKHNTWEDLNKEIDFEVVSKHPWISNVCFIVQARSVVVSETLESCF